MGDKRVYLILLMLPFSRVIFFRHDKLIINNSLVQEPSHYGSGVGTQTWVLRIRNHPLCHLSHCILGYIVLITSCQLKTKLAKFQP